MGADFSPQNPPALAGGYLVREYGGININVEDIKKIPEIKVVINEVYENLYNIDSIYYRENGLININLSKEYDRTIHYENITLRCIDNTWEVVPSYEFGDKYGGGIYLKSMIPTIATYPNEFPF